MVPLFETLDDLHNAPATITTLFSNAWYISHINGVQECMIGESATPHQCRPQACTCVLGAWGDCMTARVHDLREQIGVCMCVRACVRACRGCSMWACVHPEGEGGGCVCLCVVWWGGWRRGGVPCVR